MRLAPIVSGLVLAAALAGADPAAPPARHRVVFQVQADSEQRWQEALNNVENLQRAFGAGNVDIVVVTHGKGVGLVATRNEAVAKRVDGLIAGGIRFDACANTCRRESLAQGDLVPGVVIVDSGVAEVVRLQEAGFSYIKTGS